MTSVWARIAGYIDAAERLRGAARWLAGAAVWGLFAAACVAPMACAYMCGRGY